jgi:hypothetical protein
MQLADAYGMQGTFSMLASHLKRSNPVDLADAVLEMLPPRMSLRELRREVGAKAVESVQQAGLDKGGWRAWASLCVVLAEQNMMHRPPCLVLSVCSMRPGEAARCTPPTGAHCPGR